MSTTDGFSECQELFFLQQLLWSIYDEHLTTIEHDGEARGSFNMGGGVSHRCPASGFLFAIAVDPIFRWISRQCAPERPFPLPIPLLLSAYAVAADFAVASRSFCKLLSNMVEASRIVEHVTGLNVNHDKCCWAHHEWLVTASEFLEVIGGADFVPKDARVLLFYDTECAADVNVGVADPRETSSSDNVVKNFC